MALPPAPPLPDRVALVVLFGGRSAEHEISCLTAASVLAALDPSRYRLTTIGIDHDGTWHRAAPDAEGALAAVGAPTTPSEVLADRPVVLPLLHGPMGEDGTIQGLLELAGVAYVGAGVLGSALCMDKAMAKDVLAGHGLPQVRYLSFAADDRAAATPDRVGATLGWPVFVKPANLGSSIGVSRVTEPGALAGAIDLAAKFDDLVVIEEAVNGRELECGILGNTGALAASAVGEVVPTHDFYDFEDKYLDGAAELRVPAPISGALADQVRALALAAADLLRVEGLARVDLFYEEGGRGLVINEVNTIPGFTPFSMYPRLWAESGLDYPELVDRLVGLALERHARRAGRVGRTR